LERVLTVEEHIVEVARRTRAARLEDQPEVTTGPGPGRAGYLGLAAEHADITVVPQTRLRSLKRLIVRLTRHITHHQVVVNHAVLGALATEPPPAPPDSSTAAVVAALEVQLEHLQDEVAALQREIGALRQDPSAQPDPEAP
jgi:hypothetical protein